MRRKQQAMFVVVLGVAAAFTIALAVVYMESQRKPQPGSNVTIDISGFSSQSQPHEKAIREWMKANTNDPAKLEILSFGTPQILEVEGQRITVVEVKFRAANAFGAKVLQTEFISLDRKNRVLGKTQNPP